MESGHGVSYTLPIYEGSALPYATFQFKIGGHELTEYLHRILTHSHTHRRTELNTFPGKEVARYIKEKLAYVSLNYQHDLESTAVERSYLLPDGKTLKIGDELFRCPEILFQPSLIGMEASNGIHETTYKSIIMVVVISGGAL